MEAVIAPENLTVQDDTAKEPLLVVKEPLLVVLVGPTASGKSALALKLALEFGGEIISCDSVAVYRELEIGTAKPSLKDREAIPHSLLDVVGPEEPYTAGDYSRDARVALRKIHARGRLPIVVGGTGLYLRAMLDGLFPGPQRCEGLRERLRANEERRGSGYLHRLLRRIDSTSADSIHANDLPKIIRAIEVYLAARQPLSEAWKQGRDALSGFRILRIGLDPPRKLLYERINSRAATMFNRGLVEETRSLVARFGPDCRPLQSLGYKQAGALLRGEMTLEQALDRTAQGHRNYAKRQMSWFRSDHHIHWLRDFGDKPETAREASGLVGATQAGGA